MNTFENAFANFVIRFRWLLVILLPVIVFMIGSGGKNLSFSTDYRVFFSEDNPELLAFDAIEKTYTKNDNVMFILSPKDGNVFTAKTLAAIEQITQEAWQIPYSIRVDSLANYQHTEAVEDDLYVHDLIENASAYGSTEIDKIKKIALNEPVLVNNIINNKGTVTGINATIQMPGIDPMRETPEIVEFVRDLAKTIEKDYSWIEVRLSGMTMMNNAFSENSQKDMKTLVLYSFLLMLAMLGFLTRSVVGTLGVLGIIVFSIMTAMGTMGFIGYPITPPSSSAPTIILTIAIASSVHVLVSILYNLRSGQEKHAAIKESIRINLQPVFIASITTAIGFMSMNFSEVPPFHHLGNITAIGVIASFFLTIMFFPAFMAIMPMRIKPNTKNNHQAGWTETLSNFVVENKNRLFFSIGILIVGLFACIPKNELNDVFVHYFDTTIDFRLDSDYMVENLTGLYRVDYSLESGVNGGISDPHFLKEVKAFADWYRSQPETIHVSTLSDTFLRLNKNMHGDDPAYYRIPENRELAAQYLLLYELSLPYGLDLNNQIDINKSATRFSANLKTMSSNEILAFTRRADQWLSKNTQYIKKAMPTGPTVMFANIGKRNIVSMLGGTTLALILISAILILALKSFKVGLISLAPNLVPAGMGFGLWGLTVGEIGLSLSIVSGMTLGIVVDDTVHFLSKYLRARREKNLSSTQAIHYAFNHVGQALFVTSVVLVSGFLVLATSHFELNAGMGLMSAIVISFALLADFFFLPALLMKFEGDHVYEKNIDPATAR